MLKAPTVRTGRGSDQLPGDPRPPTDLPSQPVTASEKGANPWQSRKFQTPSGLRPCAELRAHRQGTLGQAPMGGSGAGLSKTASPQWPGEKPRGAGGDCRGDCRRPGLLLKFFLAERMLTGDTRAVWTQTPPTSSFSLTSAPGPERAGRGHSSPKQPVEWAHDPGSFPKPKGLFSLGTWC